MLAIYYVTTRRPNGRFYFSQDKLGFTSRFWAEEKKKAIAHGDKLTYKTEKVKNKFVVTSVVVLFKDGYRMLYVLDKSTIK